jgi:Cu(I)/Ag(I) efflux system membrane protein CusA/SilA
VASRIILQRFGVNALDVITVYDGLNLINAAIETLKHTLLEESVIVALVCIVFLLHFRRALVAIVMLPVGILAFRTIKLSGLGPTS